MTSPSGAPGGSTTGSGRGAWAGLLVAVIAVVLVVVLMTRTRQLTPFMVDSTAPEGYAAITALWEEQGASVGAVPSSSLLDDGPADVSSRVVVVPVPGYASEDELSQLRTLAEDGATVVLGEPWPLGGAEDDPDPIEAVEEFLEPYDLPAGGGVVSWGARELAETPAVPAGAGTCDIPGLDDLGPIDVAFAWSFQAARGDLVCFQDDADISSEGNWSYYSVRPTGSGRIVTMGSPYLWVNARLQPAKEDGGRPLANAATALVLTGAAPGVRIDVVDPSPGSDPSFEGTDGPLELMPLPVQLALLQLVVVAGLFLWWRSVRLGRPVEEALPVEIAGSELVVAVGDLLRRKGSPDRAAAALRRDTREVLAARLGATGASDEVLVRNVAARTGRPVAEVGAALVGTAPVDSASSLVQLARTLDSIRTEVLSVPEPT